MGAHLMRSRVFLHSLSSSPHNSPVNCKGKHGNFIVETPGKHHLNDSTLMMWSELTPILGNLTPHASRYVLRQEPSFH